MELKIKHTCKYCNEEFTTGAKLGNHISKQCLKNPNRGIQKNSKIWKCSICNCDFSSRRILQAHRKTEHRKTKHEREIKGFYGYHPKINAICKFCGKICSRKCDLTRHEKFCKENPDRSIWKGHKTTEETKAKLSAAAIKNLRDTHCNWLNKPKSYAEEYFDKIFIDAKFQYRVDKYVLDYAWPETKTYVEVDGEQHYTEQGLEHDKERTEFLSQLGWNCLKRIRWSEYQKLSYEDKRKFLYENHLIKT